MPSICKMCHNFHMQWMCQWMFWLPRYHLSHQQSFQTCQNPVLVPPRQQISAQFSDWGYRLIQDGHINTKHKEGAVKPS